MWLRNQSSRGLLWLSLLYAITVCGAESHRTREEDGLAADYWRVLEESLHVFAEINVTNRWSTPLPEGKHNASAPPGPGAAQERWRQWQSPLHASPLKRLYDRSLTNVGDPERLQAFLHKLQSGEPVTVDVIGGSVSANGIRKGNPDGSDKGYIRLFWDWLTTAFPHPDHVLMEDVESGTTVASRSLCSLYSEMQHKGIDLFIVEMAVNLPNLADTAEKLVRSAYLHTGRPALLLLHWFNLPHLAHQPGVPAFTYTDCNKESDFRDVSAYYGLPAVSFKAALWTLLEANRTRCRGYFTNFQCDRDEFSGRNLLWKDGRHPTGPGDALMATFLLQFLTERLHRQHAQRAGAAGPLLDAEPAPPPLFTAAFRQTAGTTFQGHEVGSGPVSTVPNLRHCFHDEELHALPTNVSGWEWKVEHSKTGLARPGWVSTTPGAVIEFDLGLWVDKLWVGYLQTYENIGRARIECRGGASCQIATINAMKDKKKVSLHQVARIQVVPTSDPEKRPTHGILVDKETWTWAKDSGENSVLRITNVGAEMGPDGNKVKEAASDKFKINAVIVSKPRLG